MARYDAYNEIERAREGGKEGTGRSNKGEKTKESFKTASRDEG